MQWRTMVFMIPVAPILDEDYSDDAPMLYVLINI
jgi:hypothetical protein